MAKVNLKITAEGNADKKVQSFTGSIIKGTLAVDAFKAASRKLIQVGKESISLFIEQERAEKLLENAITSTKMAAGLTATELKGMASSFAELTNFTDQAIISAEAMLLTFTNIGKDVFPTASQAVLDMAEFLGVDATSAAKTLGASLNDPVVGLGKLKEASVSFTPAQIKLVKELSAAGDIMGAQTVLLKELEVQYGGAAKAARDTFGGGLKDMQKSINETKEAFGGLTSFLTKDFTQGITAASSSVTKFINSITTLISEDNKLNIKSTQIDKTINKLIKTSFKYKEITKKLNAEKFKLNKTEKEYLTTLKNLTKVDIRSFLSEVNEQYGEVFDSSGNLNEKFTEQEEVVDNLELRLGVLRKSLIAADNSTNAFFNAFIKTTKIDNLRNSIDEVEDEIASLNTSLEGKTAKIEDNITRIAQAIIDEDLDIEILARLNPELAKKVLADIKRLESEKTKLEKQAEADRKAANKKAAAEKIAELKKQDAEAAAIAAKSLLKQVLSTNDEAIAKSKSKSRDKELSELIRFSNEAQKNANQLLEFAKNNSDLTIKDVQEAKSKEIKIVTKWQDGKLKELQKFHNKEIDLAIKNQKEKLTLEEEILSKRTKLGETGLTKDQKIALAKEITAKEKELELVNIAFEGSNKRLEITQNELDEAKELSNSFKEFHLNNTQKSADEIKKIKEEEAADRALELENMIQKSIASFDKLKNLTTFTFTTMASGVGQLSGNMSIVFRDALTLMEDDSISAKEKILGTFAAIGAGISSTLSSITDIMNTHFELRQEQRDLDTEGELEKLEADTTAKLEAIGISDENDIISAEERIKKLEKIEAAAKTAEAKADAKANLAAAKTEVDRLKILKKAKDEKAKIEDKADKKETEAKKKQFESNKALAIAQIWINAAVAILGFWSSFASMGVPGIALAAIMTGVVTGVAIAQTVVVGTQEPGFADGGVISGNSLTGDRVSINANSAERVLTARQNKVFEEMVFGSGGRGGGDLFIENVNIESNDLDDLREQLIDLQREESGRR